MGVRGLVRWGRGRGGDPRRGGVYLDPLAGGERREERETNPVESGNERVANVCECCTHW